MAENRLNEISHEMYLKGVLDEEFVMNVVTSKLGGTCEKSSTKSDVYEHVDFWWDSPKKGRLGVDVKGLKKSNRTNKDFDDTINWIEILNVQGRPGWLYGKATYIAFRTKTKILFVKTSKLQTWVNSQIEGKQLVNINPKEYYIPYQRQGRKDMIIKVPTSDLENLSHFIIEI